MTTSSPIDIPAVALQRNADIPDAIDNLAARQLGIYVYVLVDPRDSKVFYVGKGQGERVLHHERIARSQRVSYSSDNLSEKNRRISELKLAGLKPDWHVVRRQLENAAMAYHVEAAIIYAFKKANSQPLANQNSGMNVANHGGISSSDVRAILARPVEPQNIYPCVFIFNIEKGLRDRRTVYEATRHAWQDIDLELRSQDEAVAVGLIRGICHGVFKVRPGSWIEVDHDDERWAFDGDELHNELKDTDWSRITSLAGNWQFGGRVVVQFDGKGQFRFLKGSKDKVNWHRVSDLAT